ncbi:unnamed protein product [Amaranthus hypochondriacus]
MASTKSYMITKNYRFLTSDPIQTPIKTSTESEFQESDIWGGSTRSGSPDSRPSWRQSRRPLAPPTPARSRCGNASSSLPVNIPDWSKILREEYKSDKWNISGEFDGEDNGSSGDGEDWVPPHEYLAKNRIASLSVHEGIGRTLKGRDLSKVRNAIWEKIGFQD